MTDATEQRIALLQPPFGFEVTEELRFPGDGPAVWRMWCEPTPA